MPRLSRPRLQKPQQTAAEAQAATQAKAKTAAQAKAAETKAAEEAKTAPQAKAVETEEAKTAAQAKAAERRQLRKPRLRAPKLSSFRALLWKVIHLTSVQTATWQDGTCTAQRLLTPS